MSPNSFFAKFLRFLGIVLMGLTAGFTLLGGIGTTWFTPLPDPASFLGLPVATPVG